jgi:hypothetical protein
VGRASVRRCRRTTAILTRGARRSGQPGFTAIGPRVSAISSLKSCPRTPRDDPNHAARDTPPGHLPWRRGPGGRRNGELPFRVRFENISSVRPIVLSLSRATMFKSMTLSSSRFNVHRARPFGGSEHRRAGRLASEAPSNMRGPADAGECLCVSTKPNPSSTSCWWARAIVARLVSRAETSLLSLYASGLRQRRPSTGCEPS